MLHATGFKTAGDWGVLDLQLLLGEWGFYEADTISLAYRVLTIFMAGWDLLEAPSWNVMEFPIRECPQERGLAWFPGTQRCQRAGFMESNFLSKEKYAPETERFEHRGSATLGLTGFLSRWSGDCKDKWALLVLGCQRTLLPFRSLQICIFKIK